MLARQTQRVTGEPGLYGSPNLLVSGAGLGLEKKFAVSAHLASLAGSSGRNGREQNERVI
jgi:hypothetical protein